MEEEDGDMIGEEERKPASLPDPSAMPRKGAEHRVGPHSPDGWRSPPASGAGRPHGTPWRAVGGYLCCPLVCFLALHPAHSPPLSLWETFRQTILLP